MEQRTKRQKLEHDLKEREEELKLVEAERLCVKREMYEKQERLKEIEGMKLEIFTDLVNDGWFLKMKWGNKTIHFKPFATVDDLQNEMDIFKATFDSICEEYSIRFARYFSIFLPKLDREKLIERVFNKINMTKGVLILVKAYCTVDDLNDMVESLNNSRFFSILRSKNKRNGPSKTIISRSSGFQTVPLQRVELHTAPVFDQG